MANSIENPESASGNPPRTPRLRSVAYPSYTLENSIRFTEKIDKELTSVVYSSAEDVSKTIGLSGGPFLMQLSTAVQYGLLEKKQSQGYKPTQLFAKIIKPLPNENIRDFHIECLQLPSLYKKLLTEFRDRQLPSETGLANILDRNYGVKGKAANRASKTFLNNLSFTNLIAEGNVLKFDSYLPFTEEENEEDLEQNNPPESGQNVQIIVPAKQPRINPPPEQASPKKNTKEFQIVLNGENREARVILPSDFDDSDLKRIVKIIEAYIP